MGLTTQTLQEAYIGKTSRSLVGRLGGPMLVLVWPWVLLAVNRSWLFLNGTFVDSWIYFGFFHNLREYEYIYASANSSHMGFYYDDRLSWILLGYLVYQLFSPLVANYILHLGLYYVVSLALYTTLALTIHHRAAVLVTLLMGSYSYFLIAVGWDYVDGVGLAYCSLTLLLITLAAQRPRWPLWLGLTGVTASALVFSNIFWVALVPCIGLFYLIINRHHSLKRILLGVAPPIIGALSLTAGIGLINLSFGGSPFFFASSLEFASYSTKLPANPWIILPTGWPIADPYLVWPLLILLACALWLVIPRLRRSLSPYPQALAFLALFLCMALSMLAVHLRGSTPVLQAFFYASYLVPALFLAIAVILAPLLSLLNHARFAGLLGITMLTVLGSFAFRACGEFPITYPALPAFVLGLIWLGLLIVLPRKVWSYGVFLLAFCVATPSAFTSYAASYVTNSFCRFTPQTQLQPEDQYLAVLDSMETIRQITPKKQVFFWFNEREQPIYSALSSAYLYTWNQVSRNFPAFGGADTSFPGFAPPSGLTVVILSRHPNPLEEAQTTLGRRNRSLRLLGQRDIRRGEIQFKLLIGVIEAVPEHVALDTMLDFTRPGQTDRYLLDGWWGPDTTGTWTDGPKAELHMLLDHSQHQDVDMTVNVANTIGAFVTYPLTMTVHVAVNKIQLADWHFNAETKGGAFRVLIPAQVLDLSETTVISFDIVDPHTPRDLGINYNDIRALGMEVRNVEFTKHNFWNAQNELLGAPPPNGIRVGRSEADGWSANPTQDSEGYLQYGPYTTTVTPGDHTAVWRLMIDNNTIDDLPIARLDVVETGTKSSTLASRVLTRRQWRSVNQYEEFTVPFSLAAMSPPHQVELRIYWYDRAYVREQNIQIR